MYFWRKFSLFASNFSIHSFSLRKIKLVQYYYFSCPQISPEFAPVLLSALVDSSRPPQMDSIRNLVSFSVLFCLEPLKSLMLQLCWGTWKWQAVYHPCTQGPGCNRATMAVMFHPLLCLLLPYFYLYFLFSFHFCKFLLVMIWSSSV
jgi:hypothetical protein